MPIYEFACAVCGARFEELLSRAAPDPPCPSCGSRSVSRLISTFATGGDGGGGCACGGRCACGRRG